MKTDLKNRDEQIKKMISKVTPVSPSEEFLQKVMKQVSAMPVPSGIAVAYQPLISKRGWFLILTIVAAMLVWAFYATSPAENKWPVFQQVIVTSVDNFSVFFSRVFVLGMVVLTALFVTQIWLLSRRQQKTQMT